MRYGRCRAVRLKHDARRASADSGGSSMPGGERATRARLAGPPVLALYRLAVAVPVSAWLAAGTAGWGGRLPGLSLAQAAGWVLVLVLFELLPAPRRGGPGLRVTFAAQVAIALLYPAQVAATLAFLGGVEARRWGPGATTPSRRSSRRSAAPPSGCWPPSTPPGRGCSPPPWPPPC